MKKPVRLGVLTAAATIALVSFAGTGVALASPAPSLSSVVPTVDPGISTTQDIFGRIDLSGAGCLAVGDDTWVSIQIDVDDVAYDGAWVDTPPMSYDEDTDSDVNSGDWHAEVPFGQALAVGAHTITAECVHVTPGATDDDPDVYTPDAYAPLAFTVVAPALTVSAASVAAGGTVAVSGDGNECFGGDDWGTATPATVTIAGVTAAAGAPAATPIPGLLGAWTATVAIPASTAPGTYAVTGHCSNPAYDYAAASIVVTPAPVPAPTAFTTVGTASVTGTAAYGKTLTAHTTAWTPAASGYSYTWLASGKAISGQHKATLQLAAAQVGKKIAVKVTATGTGFTATSAASKTTKAVTGAFTAPKPKITGTVKAGKTVKVAVGTWKPVKPALKIQWLANGKAVKGATKPSLKIAKSLVGKKLTVKVTGAKAGWTSKAVLSAAKKVAR